MLVDVNESSTNTPENQSDRILTPATKPPVVSQIESKNRVTGEKSIDLLGNSSNIVEEFVSYRNYNIEVKSLIDMRRVIHQKIEQVFSQSALWNQIMPSKIFNDLLSFVSHIDKDTQLYSTEAVPPISQSHSQEVLLNENSTVLGSKNNFALSRYSSKEFVPSRNLNGSVGKNAGLTFSYRSNEEISHFLPQVPNAQKSSKHKMIVAPASINNKAPSYGTSKYSNSANSSVMQRKSNSQRKLGSLDRSDYSSCIAGHKYSHAVVSG